MPAPTQPVRMMRCPTCGANNRVPQENLDRGMIPVCGRCKTRLLPAAGDGGKPVTVNDANFAAEVEQARGVVLVDLWAPWCGPCRAMGPIIEELAAEMADRAKIAKLNTDENQATAGRFQISGIPTLLIFNKGREIDRIVGLHPKAEIVRRLERAMGA